MIPAHVNNGADDTVDMEAYARNVPLWKRVHQHSLTQMMLISVQAFCGPAMSDAIAGMCRAPCCVDTLLGSKYMLIQE